MHNIITVDLGEVSLRVDTEELYNEEDLNVVMDLVETTLMSLEADDMADVHKVAITRKSKDKLLVEILLKYRIEDFTIEAKLAPEKFREVEKVLTRAIRLTHVMCMEWAVE